MSESGGEEGRGPGAGGAGGGAGGKTKTWPGGAKAKRHVTIGGSIFLHLILFRRLVSASPFRNRRRRHQSSGPQSIDHTEGPRPAHARFPFLPENHHLYHAVPAFFQPVPHPSLPRSVPLLIVRLFRYLSSKLMAMTRASSSSSLPPSVPVVPA